MELLGTIASSTRQGLATNSFESIASVTLTSTASTISFTSISSSYTHLQIRYNSRHDNDTQNNMYMRLNSDNSSIYMRMYIFTDGTTIQTIEDINTDAMGYFSVANSSRTANNFGGGIINILDYKNTSKNKSVLARTGRAQQASGTTGILMSAGQWASTSAVDTITFGMFAGEGNFVTNTTFALYGIKTA